MRPYKPPNDDRHQMVESAIRRSNNNEYPEYKGNRRSPFPRSQIEDRHPERNFDPTRSSGDDRILSRVTNSHGRASEMCSQNQQQGGEFRGEPRDTQRRHMINDHSGYEKRGYRGDRSENGVDRRIGQWSYNNMRPEIGSEIERRRQRHQEQYQQRINRNWDRRDTLKSDRDYYPNTRGTIEVDRQRGFGRNARSIPRTDETPSYYSDDREKVVENRSNTRSLRRPTRHHIRFSDFKSDMGGHQAPNDMTAGFRNEHKFHTSGSQKQQPTSRGYGIERTYENSVQERPRNGVPSKRSYGDYQKQQPSSRGYDIEPPYAKRRSTS